MKPTIIAILGGVLLLLGFYILWRAHRSKDSAVNLDYILVDGALVPPRVSLAKLTGFGAWCASTWWLTYLTMGDKFDAGAFTAYVATWGAVKVAGDVVAARKPE